MTHASATIDTTPNSDISRKSANVGVTQSNGTINFVTILFDAPISTATLTFDTAHNDGFGLDDATAATVAPIPLPVGGVLLLSGLLGFAALRRRD